jgi:nucleotide-binding universal stress UspA family protein
MDNNEDLKTILVLTDFSKSALHAADYAVFLARQLKANILLFNSYYVPIPGFDSWPTKDYPALMQNSKLKLENEANRLNDMVNSNQDNFKPVISYLSDGGLVEDNVYTIISERNNIMMLVMGGYKACNNDDVLFGSEITAVLSKAKCPAVIVPEYTFLQD